MPWKLIENHLTGYGRMIFFHSKDKEMKPENNSLHQIVEGQFKKGKMDGYCRVFDTTYRNCHVGYYQND